MPRQSQLIKIPVWVPASVRQTIEDLWQGPLDETARAVLKRLATYPAMRTEVWEKLPREAESSAADVIECAVIAVVAFPALRPSPKGGRREAWERWTEFRRKHPLRMSGQTYASFAAQVRDDALSNISDALWARHWQGDPVLDRAYVVGILDAVARTYQSMAVESEAMLTALQFPEVHRWDDPGAPERFFSEWMSHRLHVIYGRAYDPVVAALTAVAFDREDVGTETVRWRLRTDRRK